MGRSVSSENARVKAKIVTRTRLQLLNVMYLRCFLACRESGPEKAPERSKICADAFEEQLKEIEAARSLPVDAPADPDNWWADKLQHFPHWVEVAKNPEVCPNFHDSLLLYPIIF